jgi:predicted amidohydrolase YtcJ
MCIDCRGATVLPGIVDPHLHLFGLAARDAHLDCSAFADVEALLDAVGARAAGLEPDTWVRGEGLDETRLGRLPTAAELERVAPRNPVRLRHRSRHASILSRRGVSHLPADLSAIERVRGVPTGLVAGAEDDVGRAVGPLGSRDLQAGFRRASRELASMGVTTVADATPRTWRGLSPVRRAMADGAIVQRVFAMRPWDAASWRGRGRLHPGPVKLMVEETPEGLVPSPEALARRIRIAAAHGAQVAVHCTGAATLIAALAAFASLPRRHRMARRHRLEHVGECPPPMVAQIAALDLTVVTNPAFVYWRGDVYRGETQGAARAWLYRARSLCAAGIAVAAASDAPVVSPNPWYGIAAARSRRTRAGWVVGAGERLAAAEALRCFTVAAARSLRAERLGVLAPGAKADLIVVTPDPLRASPRSVRETRVHLTMIDGRIAWQA